MIVAPDCHLKSYATLIVCASVFLCSSSTSPQCRDDKGEPVDWFYIYKLPRERNHINPLIRRGVAYMYLTPSQLQGGWAMSAMAISDPLSMLGRTLAPLYEDNTTVSVVYNDQPPDQPPQMMQSAADMDDNSPRGKQSKNMKANNKLASYYDGYELAEDMRKEAEGGHTKGVVLGGNVTALWLVHSVPRFPPVPDAQDRNHSSYAYPPTGMRYGQSMLCLSVRASALNAIGLQLKYNEPLVVYSHIPRELETQLQNLVDVVYNRTINAAPWYHTETLTTLSGRSFLSLAKSGRFHQDLYSGLVAEQLRSDLLVETWINGPGTLDPVCHTAYQVRNVESLSILAAKMSFTSHHDHSKWAVTVPRNNTRDPTAGHWVCVGDINRALSQESRGGGTVCTSEPVLWGHFAHLVDTVQTCK